tara:strand:+ start:55 stop:399 length:345 start_codon:yes stop_codon:yes gene_type:complete
MKIEKDYFMQEGKFTEVFSVERIDFVNEHPYFKTKATYSTLKEALKDFYNQCKKHKDTIFRIEPYNIYWWQDGLCWKFDQELNLDFQLGNDCIYISNIEGWEGHVKKLLNRKNA